MRPRQPFVALVAIAVMSSCSDIVHAPWSVRFPSDGSLTCSAGLELWIQSGGCDGPTELYRAGFEIGAAPSVIETLPPGRYGFGARAHDASGNWFAEGCAVATLPRSDGTPIVVVLVRTGAPLDCAAADGGPDASDAGPSDARVDAGVDGGDDAGDPCARDDVHSIEAVGCNGPLRGAAAEDHFGGYCLYPADTCVDPGTFCLPFDDPMPMYGLCVFACPPASTFSSAGRCPSGSRCFTLSPTEAYCFPDCRVGTDCATGVCLSIGSC